MNITTRRPPQLKFAMKLLTHMFLNKLRQLTWEAMEKSGIELIRQIEKIIIYIILQDMW